MDLADVLQRILSGEREAFAELVGRFQQPLFGFLGRMGLSQAQAEDIAQETFLRAWCHLRDFDRRRASFPTWLYTIARRLALNELARAPGTVEVAMPMIDDQACDGPQPPDVLRADERRQRLRRALLALSVADRTLLALAYLEDLPLAEIARIEDCRTGAIRTRLHRARSRLAGLLEYGDA